MSKRLLIAVFALLSNVTLFSQSAESVDSSAVSFPFSSADASRFIRPQYLDFTDMLAVDRSMAPVMGNKVEVIRGMHHFELLTADLASAKESICMEYYEFPDGDIPGTVRNLIMGKASDGVDVKLLVENITNLGDVPSGFYSGMRRSGVEMRMFTPFVRPLRFLFRLDHRNHQKIAVIDGRVGYIGGMNMADVYFKDWGDTHLRIEGPAAYVGVGGVFWNMWPRAGTEPFVPFADTLTYPMADSLGKIVQVVSDGPFDGHRLMEDSYVWLLDNASDYFYARTPYFSPPGDVLAAMKRAAKRGVDVRIILPGRSDVPVMDPVNRSFYRTCLESGIKIYTCHGPFNHGKTFVTDDYVTSIGSVNLDYRSFRINYEDNAFIYDQPVAGYMKGEFESECSGSCDMVTMRQVKDTPFLQKVLQGIVRLISSQM